MVNAIAGIAVMARPIPDETQRSLSSKNAAAVLRRRCRGKTAPTAVILKSLPVRRKSWLDKRYVEIDKEAIIGNEVEDATQQENDNKRKLRQEIELRIACSD